jgi:predicted TIM-barrel fold metal-dependent hydrolase
LPGVGSRGNGSAGERLLVVSADGHATPPIHDIVSYLDYPARELVDELVRENFTFVDLAAKPRRPSKETLERFDTRHLVRSGGEYGAGNPQIRLEQMDFEGIAGEIIHPHAQTNAPPFFVGQSLVVRAAGARAYNRWLADFIAASQGRLFGVAESGPLHDIDAAVNELAWAREHGFVAVSAPGSFPSPHLPYLYDEYFERFWSACEDLGLVLSVHAGWAGTHDSIIDFTKMPPAERQKAMMAAAGNVVDDDPATQARLVTEAMGQKGSVMRRGLQQPRRVMWQLMAGGVLDRHPGLKIALTEIRADWVPATLAHLAARFSDVHVTCKRSPREYWERQFLVTPSSIHRAEVATREDIGIKQLAFGQDFPHWEGTWPHTLSWLQDAFSELPEDEIYAVLAGNAVAFYGLPADRLRVIADRIGPHVEEILGDHTVSEELIEHMHHRSGYLRPVDPFYPDEIDVALTSYLSGLAAPS